MPISKAALDILQRAVDEVGHTIIVTCTGGCKHYLYPRPAQSDMSDTRGRSFREGDPGFAYSRADADIAEGFASPRGPADVDDDSPFPYSDFGG